MKKITLRATLTILTLFLFCITIQAQVLWHGDPNESVNSQFYRFDPGSASFDYCDNQTNIIPKVSTPTDSEFGKVWKINKPVGRKRGEFARTSLIPQNNNTYYYGWRWKINSNTPITDEVTVWQWKTDQKGNLDSNKQHYPLNMEYVNDTLKLNAFGPGSPNWTHAPNITQRRTTIWSTVVNENQWVAMVIKLKLSTDDTQGEVEFWFNGEKQTLGNADYNHYQVALSSDNMTAYHRTYDGGEIYPKWGSYNRVACSYNINTFYDEIRIGADLNSVIDPLGGINNGGNPNDISGLYYFKNIATGRYLDSDGTSVKTNSANNGYTDKQWRLVATEDGYYNIDCNHAGRGVLDSNPNKVVINSTTQPNTTAAFYNDKEWIPEVVSNNTYRFKNRFTGRYYLAENTSNNTIEYTGWNGKRAQWELIPVAASKSASPSIEEQDTPSISTSISPNPATSFFTINTGKETPANILVFDLQGQLIMELTVVKTTTIQTAAFSPGIYLVQTRDTQGIIWNKNLVIK